MSRSLVSFRLADDLKLALRERASAEGISVTELVNRLLRQGLFQGGEQLLENERLSHLENTVQSLVSILELERLKYEASSQLGRTVENRVKKIEKKVEQIISDVESRRRKLEDLMKERQNNPANRQKVHQEDYLNHSVEVSLEDLWSLLEPASKLTEVE